MTDFNFNLEEEKMLTPEQIEVINNLPAEFREQVRSMFIKTQAEQWVKKQTQIANFQIDANDYVTAVLTNDNSLKTQLELIALAIYHLDKDSLQRAIERFGEDFAKFSGIDFMRIVAATGIKRWNAARDVKGKMQKELDEMNNVVSSEIEEVEEKIEQDLPPILITSGNVFDKVENEIVVEEEVKQVQNGKKKEKQLVS